MEETLTLSPGSTIRIAAGKLKYIYPKFFRLGNEVYTQAFGELTLHGTFRTEQGAKDYIAGDSGQ